MLLSSGTKLGPYEILSPLGAGGMGEVYRARDTRLDRTVAVKILPEHLSSPESRQRFDREARAISSLSHPNVCHLYDGGQQEATHISLWSIWKARRWLTACAKVRCRSITC
jgi:eukaryotic-like serine/threonine-protein kinase